MADNLQSLKNQIAACLNPDAGVGQILVVDHKAFENAIVETVGRYTGLPFVARRSPTDGIVPAGNLFWNANAMNKNTPFDMYISNTTLDATRLSRMLGLLAAGDVIKFKDFIGRTTTLEYLGHSVETDDAANSYCVVSVSGFSENNNYAYQVADAWPCMIEFFKTSNPQTFTTGENNVIWNEGDARVFDMADLENETLKPMMVFQNGTKLKHGTQWTLAGGVVTILDTVDIFDGDRFEFPGII